MSCSNCHENVSMSLIYNQYSNLLKILPRVAVLIYNNYTTIL